MMSPDYVIQQIRDNNPDLTQLTTREWAITDELIVNLADALKENSHLTRIMIINSEHPNSHFTEVGAEALCHALSQNRTLVSLRLMAGVVGNSKSVEILGKMLRNNRSITYFEMTDSPINQEAMTEIAGALKEKNRTLTYLELRNCQINPESCVLLAEALTKNHRVQQLDLSVNPIGDQGVAALGASLRQNLGLRKLTLKQVSLSDQAGAQLFENMKHSRFMRVINLDMNQLGPQSSLKLAELLDVNPLIESVRVQDNPQLDLPMIHRSVTNNRGLMEFEGAMNHETVRQIQAIARANRKANLVVCRLLLLGLYDSNCTYRGAVNRDALFFILQALSYQYMSQDNFNSLSDSIAGVMGRRGLREAAVELLPAAPVQEQEQEQEQQSEQQEAPGLIEVPLAEQTLEPGPEIHNVTSVKPSAKTHELISRSLKAWFDPAADLQQGLSLENIWRVFAGRLDRPWKQFSVGNKQNHIGLSDIPSLGTLYLLEAFFRGNWIKDRDHAKTFAAVFSPIWVPLQGVRILMSAAVVLTLVAVVVAVVVALLPFALLLRGAVILSDKIDRLRWTRTLKKNDQGELDFSVLDKAEQKIKFLKPENKMWVLQEDNKGRYQATLQDRNSNIDSCTKMIKKTSQAQAQTETRTIYEWATHPRAIPSFKIKASEHYAVLWRRPRESARRDNVANDLPREDVHPDRFCYQSRA